LNAKWTSKREAAYRAAVSQLSAAQGELANAREGREEHVARLEKVLGMCFRSQPASCGPADCAIKHHAAELVELLLPFAERKP
jgi:hypothetical protein